MHRLESYQAIVEERLEKSGLAVSICSSSDCYEIHFRKLPPEVFSSKHRNIRTKDGSYYRFLYDSIIYIIDNAGEPFAKYSVRLMPKSLLMDKSAVRLFNRGWENLKSQSSPEKTKPAEDSALVGI